MLVYNPLKNYTHFKIENAENTCESLLFTILVFVPKPGVFVSVSFVQKIPFLVLDPFQSYTLSFKTEQRTVFLFIKFYFKINE